MTSIHVTPESLSASSKSSVKMNLPLLQSKMKIDPECYESELELIYNQFKSSLTLFQQQAALSFTSLSGVAADPSVSKDLGDRAMFLSHVTPFYPNQLKSFPQDLSLFLRSSARSLPSALRCNVTQALILLINRKMVEIKETLALFMELQTLGDKNLRTLTFSHVIHSIKRMNQKHKNEAENRALQNILYPILQQEDEAKAKRALATLCELHRRKVWFDERTANEICRACFHASSKIMIAALSFLLDYENNQDNDDNSDGSDSDDDSTPHKQQAVLSKQAVYKAHNQGTLASKKKKKAKLQRAVRSMKRQQRLASETSISTYYSPLNHLKDAQGFAEKLFSRLKTCNERFEVKMMMLKVIARTIGLHRLVVLSFYPYIQKYIQPHQRNVTNLLAAAIQTCHDMVPPDAIEPLFKQVVNQFVHDRSSPEAIAVGLNVVREICLRMPLLMTEDLLQDLVLYKKSHEKAVSIAARSLITLFREICPSLLIKKDRGRPINPKARPKEFGEVDVVSEVPGIELLQENDDDDNDDDDEDQDAGGSGSGDEEEGVEGEDEDGEEEDGSGSSDDEDIIISDDEQGSAFDAESEAGAESEDEDIEDENEADEEGNTSISDEEDGVDQEDEDELEGKNSEKSADTSTQDNGRKRKLQDIDGQLNTADASLRALKRLAAAPKMEQTSCDDADGFLTQEDFQRIKELKAKKEAKLALAKHGLLKKNPDAKSSTFKIPTSDQLSIKRVDPDMLEVNIRKKMSKEERLALVKAGREDRGKYQARAAVKQKKTGGLSNRQKEHKKAMPLAAKRKKVARSRQDKKIQKQRAGKQFRGRKAWK